MFSGIGTDGGSAVAGRRICFPESFSIGEAQVRNLMLAVAATAVLGFSGATAAAQTPVDVTVRISNASADYVYRATSGGLGGGGWKATVTGLPSTVLLTGPSPIVYCFDNQRLFNYNTNYTYKVLTFQQFVANVGAGPGGRANQWNTINLTDLNSMAHIASTYTVGSSTANNTRQTNIWNISNNTTAGTFTGDLSGEWLVMVDKAAWEQGLTAQQIMQQSDKTWGSQSFLVRGTIVPEPSSVLLVVAGIAGLGVAARRRRTVG